MKSKYLITTALAMAVIGGASIPATTHAWSIGDMFKGDLSSANGTTMQERKQPAMQQGQKNMQQKGNKQNEQKGKKQNNAQKPVMSSEMQALMTELQTAKKAKDTAAITAVKAKIKTLQESERAAKDVAMNAALAGGYETWKTYMTSQGAPTTLFTQITADNFSTYVEYLAAQKKVRELGEKLNIKNPGMPQ